VAGENPPAEPTKRVPAGQLLLHCNSMQGNSMSLVLLWVVHCLSKATGLAP